MLTVALKDHAGKALRYAAALQAAGHAIVPEGAHADVYLTDLDAPLPGVRERIDHYTSIGAKVLLYPHGANPLLVHDCLWEPYEGVEASLVTAPGHAEYARRIQSPHATFAVGWSVCAPGPFRLCADVRHVVFAPTHPSGEGTMPDVERDANAQIYEALLRGPWRLTVRHLGTLEQNGLWPVDGVSYILGRPDLSFAEIEAADVVVAGAGTYPAMAIARGCPTVLYGQCAPPMYGHDGEQMQPLRHPERYLDYLRYPFDALDGGPLDELVHAAARSEAPIAAYRRRFVGAPFDDLAFVALVERLAAGAASEAPQLDATRAFAVLAFADEIAERPELLAGYARRFGPDDDATLILWGPGMDPTAMMDLVVGAVGAAGLDEDRLPDVLLLPLPASAALDAALAQRASATLGTFPQIAGRLADVPSLGDEPAALAA